MAVVQVAHGGHETDFATFIAPGIADLAQRLYRFCYFHYLLFKCIFGGRESA